MASTDPDAKQSTSLKPALPNPCLIISFKVITQWFPVYIKYTAWSQTMITELFWPSWSDFIKSTVSIDVYTVSNSVGGESITGN